MIVLSVIICTHNPRPDYLRRVVEALREQMLKTPLVRCDQVTWSLFGLSLAAYNALLSLILAIGCWTWAKAQK